MENWVQDWNTQGVSTAYVYTVRSYSSVNFPGQVERVMSEFDPVIAETLWGNSILDYC